MARNIGIYPGQRVPRFPTQPVGTGMAVDRSGNPITVRGTRAFGVATDGIDAPGIAAGKGIAVGIDGEENILCGEALTSSDELTPGSDAHWYRAASGEVVSAYATFDGVAGQLGRAKLLDSGYVKP
jgi:hypothetical protein